LSLFYSRLEHLISNCCWSKYLQGLAPTGRFVSLFLTFQPPYGREAPIDGTPLEKKHLGVFLQIFNILRKKGDISFKISGIGQIFVLFYIVERCVVRLTRKEIMIDFLPNGVANDHVLIMMIDVNSGAGERSE
jgi:hypothetical protein